MNNFTIMTLVFVGIAVAFGFMVYITSRIRARNIAHGIVHSKDDPKPAWIRWVALIGALLFLWLIGPPPR